LAFDTKNVNLFLVQKGPDSLKNWGRCFVHCANLKKKNKKKGNKEFFITICCTGAQKAAPSEQFVPQRKEVP
jgi:hypothetical protein